MKDLKDIVAKNITELRLESKMTQLELGNAISYSDKAISKWERAEAVPDAYVLLKLSELFGVSVDYLLKEHESERPAKIKRKVNHLSVAMVAILAVWTVFAVAYVWAYLASFNYPLLFMYAAVVSLILVTVFNSLWGNRKLNMLIVSALVFSIIATVYGIFLSIGHNFWQILLLGIPAIAIVICCFKVKVRYIFHIDKKSK